MEQPRDCLAALLDERAGRLAALGYLLTGSSHGAEELVQEAIVRVFARKTRFESTEKAEAYVRATMRTLHVDSIRRVGLSRRLLRRERAGVEEGPEAAVVERDAMARALSLLSPQKRVVIVLRFYEDLPYADIADAMGLAVGTVKRYIADAVAQLGESFDHSGERIPLITRSKR